MSVSGEWELEGHKLKSDRWVIVHTDTYYNIAPESYFLHALSAASDTADYSSSSSMNIFFTQFLGLSATTLFAISSNHLTMWVPQGSDLGPLFYLYFLGDYFQSHVFKP